MARSHDDSTIDIILFGILKGESTSAGPEMGEGSTAATDVASQYQCKLLFMTSILVGTTGCDKKRTIFES